MNRYNQISQMHPRQRRQKLVMIFRNRTVNVVVLTGIVLRDGGNLIIKYSNLIETEN